MFSLTASWMKILTNMSNQGFSKCPSLPPLKSSKWYNGFISIVFNVCLYRGLIPCQKWPKYPESNYNVLLGARVSSFHHTSFLLFIQKEEIHGPLKHVADQEETLGFKTTNKSFVNDTHMKKNPKTLEAEFRKVLN